MINTSDELCKNIDYLSPKNLLTVEKKINYHSMKPNMNDKKMILILLVKESNCFRGLIDNMKKKGIGSMLKMLFIIHIVTNQSI